MAGIQMQHLQRLRDLAQSTLMSVQELETLTLDPSWDQARVDEYMESTVNELAEVDESIGAAVSDLSEEMIP